MIPGTTPMAQDVLIVPAKKWAHECFWKYAAYVCQAGRFFRPDVTRIGYYVAGAIRPEFPAILARRLEISLTSETVQELRSTGDPEDTQFAEVVDQLVADGHEGEAQQIFLLSDPDDPRTLRIPHPILNTKRRKSGVTAAWTRKHD